MINLTETKALIKKIESLEYNLTVVQRLQKQPSNASIAWIEPNLQSKINEAERQLEAILNN